VKKLSALSALVSPRVVLGVGLLFLVTLFGGTGCGSVGLTYSLTGLSILPKANSTCVSPGATAQFKAYGSYTEGGHTTKIEDISNQVSWSASLPELATLTSSGLATAATDYIGLTPIVATTQGEFGNLTASSSLEVSDSCVSSGSSVVPAVSTLHLVPASHNLAVGDTLEPLAVSAAGTTALTPVLSRSVTWTSNSPGVASVDANGMIRGVGPGDATITASRTLAPGEAVSATETVHVQ